MDVLIAGPFLFVLVPLSLACVAFVAFGFVYVHAEFALRRVRRFLLAHKPLPAPARQITISPSRRGVGSAPLPALQ